MQVFRHADVAGVQVYSSAGVQVCSGVRLFLWSDIDGFDQILVQENEVEVDAGGTAAGAGCCVPPQLWIVADGSFTVQRRALKTDDNYQQIAELYFCHLGMNLIFSPYRQDNISAAWTHHIQQYFTDVNIMLWVFASPRFLPSPPSSLFFFSSSLRSLAGCLQR